MNFNIEIGKMLEIIATHDKARTFAYTMLILAFICSVMWLSPNFLKALAEFILTLRQS